MQTSAVAHQRQIRTFVIAWLGITLLMGALTFAGIYYATGLVNDDNNGGSSVSAAGLPADETEDLDRSGIVSTLPALAEQAMIAPAAPADQSAEVADNMEAAAAPVAESASASMVEMDEEPVESAPEPVAEEAAMVAEQPAAAAEGDSAAPDGGDPQAPPAQDATPIPTPTPPPAAEPAPALSPINNTAFQVGIQVEGSQDGNRDIYEMWMRETTQKLRLGWIKQQIRWEDIEPQPGQYNWELLDVTFELTRAYEVNVMVSVVTAPDWAREPGNQRLDEVGPPADPQVYANFLAQLIQRYPGQIHAVEVWNEMNIDREWASIYGLSADRYVELLRVSYDTIKALNPNIIVISGALSPAATWGDGSAIDDLDYMQQMVNAGMLNYADCVGAHHNGYNIGPNVPYDNVPNDPAATFRGPFDNPHHSWSFYSTLHGYNNIIQQAGGSTPLCITEFGWASAEGLAGVPAGFEFALDNTLAEQAAYFDEAIRLMDEWGFVWLAFIWNLNYGAQANWDASNDNVPYSLLRPDWSAAPAYDVIAAYDFLGP
ncbi:MAG: hypothetical protein GYB65_23055 [Chloroflexi bacterium]|nr:hypothetical protein [Chloroflexota bacterium]